MHKYQPRLVIAKLHQNFNGQPLEIVAEYAAPEMQFIAVTAYQNTKITKLKVKHNPFARGFRRNAASATLLDTEIGKEATFATATKEDRKRKAEDDATAETPPLLLQEPIHRPYPQWPLLPQTTIPNFAYFPPPIGFYDSMHPQMNVPFFNFSPPHPNLPGIEEFGKRYPDVGTRYSMY
jgi:hypothetical protein